MCLMLWVHCLPFIAITSTELVYTFSHYSNYAAHCKDLTDPKNGLVTVAGNSVGDTATYTCSDGYVLVGETMLACQMGGDWSNKPPFCRGMYRKHI